jgi:diketogulonate reductase-like aldo/keto reductase
VFAIKQHIKTKTMTYKELMTNCKDANDYFMKENFIEDLASDEQFYTEILIKYYLANKKNPISKKRKSETMEEAIDYIAFKSEEQTTDNRFYMEALVIFADNF